ncbi:cytochrome oxidase complex assembly protein [Rhodotorula toruloides]|uniref:Cytochrome oxidase complex assembly protein n=1 Tax=Rhodotorula toruloides TaxID=5286 RepID=A0A511KDA1_RHOTO|nr:cytochrome oxidase complex assembly protein [Rhodotorula toruloides]
METMPRALPELKSRVPLYLSLAVIAAGAWGIFLAYATNEERANSSVIRSLAFQLRNWPAVKEFLGDGVKIEPLVGDFVRIKGSINMLAGRIDVQFPVRGSKARGTASFTSIRRGKDGQFEVLRWKITREDGAVLDLAGLDMTKPLVGLDM